MKFLKLLFFAGVYFCVATVAAQVVGLVILWKKGALSEEKLFRLAAVVQDVDLDGIAREIEEEKRDSDAEQMATEQIRQERAEKSLDLNIRERAIQKALGELRQLQSQLQEKWKRYNQLTKAFQKELDQRQDDARTLGQETIREILSAIKPKQAKDQIIKILDEDESSDSAAMADVVRILKSMPRDKSKKIFSEFKTEEEQKQLHEILRQIRLGEPEVSVIRDTQSKLPGS